jgi:hypothetical protein
VQARVFHGQGTVEEEALWRLPGLDEREVLGLLHEQHARKAAELAAAREQVELLRRLRAAAHARREAHEAPLGGAQALRDVDARERALLDEAPLPPPPSLVLSGHAASLTPN